MRRIALVLTVLAAFGVTAAVAQDKEKKMEMPEPLSVEGILVDMKCFSMNAANSGSDHITPKGKMPACATACAKMGIPVGVLTEDDEVYVLITSGSMLSDYMALETKVTGTPALDGHGLIPDKIMVKKKGKWEEVKIATMM